MTDTEAIDRVFKAMIKGGDLKMGELARKAWDEAKEIIRRNPEILDR